MCVTKHNYHISNSLKKCIDDLEFKRDHPNELKGISTGYECLDMKLGGLKAGEVTIIGARPAMGKTAFAINLTYNIAVHFYFKCQENEQDNRCVVFVGLEYMPKEFAERLISLKSSFPIVKLRLGIDLEDNFDKLSKASQVISELPIYYVDDVASVDEIACKLNYIEKDKHVDCVVIDYLQLLGGEYQSKEDYTLVMGQIKALAVKLNVPIIVLSQLKRELETRYNKHPLRSDIRGYARNQNAADNILLLYREIYYIYWNEPIKRKKETEDHYQKRITAWQQRCKDVDDLCEIIIAKNSGGTCGRVNMRFDRNTGSFWEDR